MESLALDSIYIYSHRLDEINKDINTDTKEEMIKD